MEERKTVLDYIGQVFMIFGFTILVLSVFCLLFGENAKEYSTIFVHGKEGIGIETMLQFLLTSVITVALRSLFFTDMILKNMSVILRSAGMILSELLVIIAFILAFEWFPADQWIPWVMFFVSFGVCFAAGVTITAYRERIENRKMEEALERLRKEGAR
ncbi:MAG: hypothetical protein NC341_07275 [Blautia sp.]|nr:hypothetical protein [Blautia sp.]MCM1199733.1 hypothetical protein [Bacteroides fragilis]